MYPDPSRTFLRVPWDMLPLHGTFRRCTGRAAAARDMPPLHVTYRLCTGRAAPVWEVPPLHRTCIGSAAKDGEVADALEVHELPEGTLSQPEPSGGSPICPGPPRGCSDPPLTSPRVPRPVPNLLDGPRSHPEPPGGSPRPVSDLRAGPPTHPKPLEGSSAPSWTFGRVPWPVLDLHNGPLNRPKPP